MSRLLPLALLGCLLLAVVASPALADDRAPSEPTLLKRALLPAAATAPAPFAGFVNAEPAPAPGATQPVGGFSALLDAPGRDVYWAMPDNGFGSKANSRSFLLRVHRVRVDWETARGRSGDVEVLDSITLSDPEERIPFAIVNEGTQERLLTGGDLDVESLRVTPDGTVWFGEEFGPFLVHTDADGRVLDAPVPARGVRSPDFPGLRAGTNNLKASNGFEGTALSDDGKRLYPALEGPLTTDADQRRRLILEFDVREHRYTGRRLQYHVEDPAYLISDFTALGGGGYVVLERDNEQGAAARHKKAFVVDLRRVDDNGFLVKREVVDLLDLRDPDRISEPARPGDVGIGDPFSMPYVTIESVLPVGRDRLAIVNDTNFGSLGRNPALPDDSDFVVVRVPALR